METNIVVIGISCFFIWYLYFELFKDYVIDSFRQEVFILRDELYDYAANGNIDFNHPAYCVLRRTMNGYIRFSHRISLLEVLVFGVIINNRNKINNYSLLFESRFNESLKTVDKSIATTLKDFNKRSRMLLIRYVFASSPILSFIGVLSFIATIIPVIILIIFYNRIKDAARKIALTQISNIESEAFSVGKL